MVPCGPGYLGARKYRSNRDVRRQGNAARLGVGSPIGLNVGYLCLLARIRVASFHTGADDLRGTDLRCCLRALKTASGCEAVDADWHPRPFGVY